MRTFNSRCIFFFFSNDGIRKKKSHTAEQNNAAKTLSPLENRSLPVPPAVPQAVPQAVPSVPQACTSCRRTDLPERLHSHRSGAPAAPPAASEERTKKPKTQRNLTNAVRPVFFFFLLPIGRR